MRVTAQTVKTFEDAIKNIRRTTDPQADVTREDCYRAGLEAVFASAEFADWLNREVHSAQQH